MTTAWTTCRLCGGQRVPFGYVGDVIGSVCMCRFERTGYGYGLQQLIGDRERDALRAEVERLRAACSRENDIISQVLGRALGYPRFADDQKNFPGATDDDGVCVGDHVAASLADEAANVIRELRAEVERLRADAERYRWIAETQPDIDWISDPDNQIVVWSVSGHGYRGRTLGDAIDSAMKGGVVPSPLRGES